MAPVKKSHFALKFMKNAKKNVFVFTTRGKDFDFPTLHIVKKNHLQYFGYLEENRHFKEPLCKGLRILLESILNLVLGCILEVITMVTQPWFYILH